MNDIAPGLPASCIASCARRIKPSPSTAAMDRADSLRQAGRPIVSLVVGEPDFDTPAHIRAAAAAAMDRGATRYTPVAGTVERRRAIAAKLLRENGLKYGLDKIIAASGPKSATFTALAVTLEPGDEVIIPAPSGCPTPTLRSPRTAFRLSCPVRKKKKREEKAEKRTRTYSSEKEK